MFEEAKEILQEQAAEEGREWEGYELAIPKMNTRFINPKINGQDTSVFSGWTTTKQMRRKAIHVEVESQNSQHVHEVVTAMKNSGLVKKYWGRNAHLSNIIRDKNSCVQLTPSELTNLVEMARDHVNFQASMQSNVLTGTTSLDKEFLFYDAVDKTKVAGRVSLRHILYNYVKMQDGHSLIVEIHQASLVAEVEVIIPNTEAAKSLLE